MLKSALVAMTILGCNCEQNTCQYIRTADLQLASVADCQARMKSEIQRTNADYPLIVAVCESVWQPPAATVTTISDAPAQSEPAAPPVGRTIMVRARERYTAFVGTARDGLDGAADVISVPAGWIGRQIDRVENISW
jgi:hypothetical protein